MYLVSSKPRRYCNSVAVMSIEFPQHLWPIKMTPGKKRLEIFVTCGRIPKSTKSGHVCSGKMVQCNELDLPRYLIDVPRSIRVAKLLCHDFWDEWRL